MVGVLNAMLATIVTAQGDYDAARVLFEESLAIRRELDDETELAIQCLDG